MDKLRWYHGLSYNPVLGNRGGIFYAQKSSCPIAKDERNDE
jgi:hypothetical protein